MANTITSGLKRDIIAESVLTAFMKRLAPLGLFSTVFRDQVLEGTDKVQVPYYPLETAASKDFSGTYQFDIGTSTQSKEITVNQRKYQPASYSSAELARQPHLDPERLGEMKGAKLAEDVLVDVLGLVTETNFPPTALSGDNYENANEITVTYGNFDMDDVVDLESMADAHNWPNAMRGLVLKPSYLGNVKKDLATDGGISTFGFNPAGERMSLPILNSFNVAQTTIVPENSESLQGMAVYPSAILVAFSPVVPADMLNRMIAYQAYTDPSTGITIEYRAWADPDTDTVKEVWEVNYGCALGETAALFRIVSA